jgi:hypothetical protein
MDLVSADVIPGMPGRIGVFRLIRKIVTTVTQTIARSALIRLIQTHRRSDGSKNIALSATLEIPRRQLNKDVTGAMIEPRPFDAHSALRETRLGGDLWRRHCFPGFSQH